MPSLPGSTVDVEFVAKVKDWLPLLGDHDPDDDDSIPTPPDVVAILGFDPDEGEDDSEDK